MFGQGGELCVSISRMTSETHISHIEEAITTLNESLPPLKAFILPGSTSGETLIRWHSNKTMQHLRIAGC